MIGLLALREGERDTSRQLVLAASQADYFFSAPATSAHDRLMALYSS